MTINLNSREQSLLDSMKNRLNETDSLMVDSLLNELESSEQFTNSGHPDHRAFQHMRATAIGKKLKLSGIDPSFSGTDAASSMEENQRFHQDAIPGNSLDFEADDKIFETKRQNVCNHLKRLQSGEEKVPASELDIYLQETQKSIIKMDIEHEQTVSIRENELERIEKQELAWESEQDAKYAKARSDFFERQLRGVLPINKAQAEKLAEMQWARLQRDFGGQ